LSRIATEVMVLSEAGTVQFAISGALLLRGLITGII
jgi:hypothetical protein